MSINIPAETPDESTNPISVEEFERLHPAMLGAIRKAVREELELSHADGRTSADIQRTFDLQLVVPDVPLVFGDALHGIGQRHNGLLNVSGLCVGFRVISGIHWIALHVITSLLCAGLLILHSAGRPSNETRRKSNRRLPTHERSRRVMDDKEVFAALAAALKPMNTTKDIADNCGIKEGTLAYWRSAGIGPKFVKVGRIVMYPKEQMIAYFAQHLYQCTAEYEEEVGA